MRFIQTAGVVQMAQNQIGHMIDFETPSEQAISLHEAGHACAALIVGIPPDLIEFSNDKTSIGLARNRIPVGNQMQRRLIACAAYAVEYNLFQSGRLADSSGKAIDEKTFIDLAIGQNSSEDKKAFFAENREQNGCWSAKDDLDFMQTGQGLADNLPMDCVFALAEAMLNERSLDREKIIAIAAPYLPSIS